MQKCASSQYRTSSGNLAALCRRPICEFEGAGYRSPEALEFEGEFEGAHYSSPEALEFEFEFEGGGAPEAHYANPEFENEYESENEGEYFFSRLRRIASCIGRVVAPLAKRFAPTIARTLVGRTRVCIRTVRAPILHGRW